MITKEFKKLLIFYFSFLILLNFSNAVIPAHFLIQGITFKDMAIGQVLNFMPVILLLFFTKQLTTKKSWLISIVVYLLFILFQIQINSKEQFFFARFLSGAILFYFFLPYNVAHFKETLKENIGHSSAIMFSLGPIISIIAPISAGLLTLIHINTVWIVTFIIGFLVLFLATKQNNFKIDVNIHESLKQIKFTKWLILTEGIWEAMLFSVIPIFTLLFINTYLGYAGFVSYLAVIGAVANLIFGKLSDKIKKRAVFLYPVTIILGITTLLFTTTINNYSTWIILVSIINLIIPIFWNLSTAIIIDSVSDTTKAMPGRELMLAVGRISGSILVFLSLIYESQPKLIFIILAVAIFIYPIIMFWNNNIKKNISYF